jgi:hypothetical protein
MLSKYSDFRNCFLIVKYDPFRSGCLQTHLSLIVVLLQLKRAEYRGLRVSRAKGEVEKGKECIQEGKSRQYISIVLRVNAQPPRHFVVYEAQIPLASFRLGRASI